MGTAWAATTTTTRIKSLWIRSSSLSAKNSVSKKRPCRRWAKWTIRRGTIGALMATKISARLLSLRLENSWATTRSTKTTTAVRMASMVATTTTASTTRPKKSSLNKSSCLSPEALTSTEKLWTKLAKWKIKTSQHGAKMANKISAALLKKTLMPSLLTSKANTAAKVAKVAKAAKAAKAAKVAKVAKAAKANTPMTPTTAITPTTTP